MKALLEFDLSDPDDRDDHTLMLSAWDFREVLRKLGDEMRAAIKYDAAPLDTDGSDDWMDGAGDATEHWQTRLYQLCDHWEVSPWD